MNAAQLIAALDLPHQARVDQRVPKKLLLENGAPTAADKRIITDGVGELLWLAALKPTNVGVPEYRDAERHYLEIAVLRLTLRPQAKSGRLVELVHRAIPYPLLLIAEADEHTSLSLVHKRWAQNEADKTVLDGPITAVTDDDRLTQETWIAFCGQLNIGRQPRATLYHLYQGWTDTLLSLAAAMVTGTFSPTASPAQTDVRRHALNECERLEKEIARLRATAAKTKQIARLVDMNLQIKKLEAQLAATVSEL